MVWKSLALFRENHRSTVCSQRRRAFMFPMLLSPTSCCTTFHLPVSWDAMVLMRRNYSHIISTSDENVTVPDVTAPDSDPNREVINNDLEGWVISVGVLIVIIAILMVAIVILWCSPAARNKNYEPIPQSWGMMTSWNGNTFHIIDSWCWESTGHGRITSTKGQYCGGLLYLLFAWTNSRIFSDLRRHGAHVTSLLCWFFFNTGCTQCPLLLKKLVPYCFIHHWFYFGSLTIVS